VLYFIPLKYLLVCLTHACRFITEKKKMISIFDLPKLTEHKVHTNVKLVL